MNRLTKGADDLLTGLVIAAALAIAASMIVSGCQAQAKTPADAGTCTTYTIDAGRAPSNPGF